MIYRSFLLSAIFCCVCFVGQLQAQQTIVKPAVDKPASAKPAKPPAVKPKKPADSPQQKAMVNKAAGFKTQDLLPANTKAWLSIPDANDLSKRFDQSQFGELAKNKTLKPFADSLKTQLKDWVDQQNVRLNLDMDQLEGVNSGEICFAGVLHEDGQHGILFLMDVSNTRDKAVELGDRISKKLIGRGATRKEDTMQGVTYEQLTLDKPKVFRTPRVTFQAIVDVKGDNKSSWMLVSNNLLVFRDVLRRLTNPERIQAVETLAAQPSFKTVMAQTHSPKIESQLKWFVDPFGYLELAQKIRDEESPSKVPRNNLWKKLADAGFDAFRGVGGQVSVMTGKHEVLHKTFVYTDRKKAGNGQKKVFDLLDFDTNKNLPRTMPKWVPEDASSIIIGDWNTQKAEKAFGHFWDSQSEEGSWERLKRDLRQDPNLRFDLEGVVEQLGNRFVIVAAAEKPISTDSERVVISVLLKGRTKFVFDNISRSNPDARIIKVGGMDFIEIDSTRETEGPIIDIDDGLDDLDDIDGLDDLRDLDGSQDEDEQKEKQRFELFAKRYLVVVGNELLICNNKNYLKKIVASKKSKIETAADFTRVKTTLAELSDDTKVAWRQFGRLDKGLETNYEMMRRGEMASSQTMLARVINQIFNKQAAETARLEGKDFDPDAVREQELDGTKLPKDFSKSIAPYLGPTGTVVEILDGGWRITGVILNRETGPVKNQSEVPAKSETVTTDKATGSVAREANQTLPMTGKTAKKP